MPEIPRSEQLSGAWLSSKALRVFLASWPPCSGEGKPWTWHCHGCHAASLSISGEDVEVFFGMMIKSWTECWFQRNDDLILLFLIESAVYFVRQSCRDADISILPGTFGASAPCSETMVGSTLCLDLRAFRCLRCLKPVTQGLPILLSFGISQFYWRCHTWVNCGNIEAWGSWKWTNAFADLHTHA